MDVSTSLVQAYLHINGYFTATDYPLVKKVRNHAPRMLTDIDMLAVRFGHRPQHQSDIKSSKPPRQVTGPVAARIDPLLAGPEHNTDMIVAEVKQGRAQVNPAARDQHALAAALMRFGCCDPATAPNLVQALLQTGHARTSGGHEIRMVLFASRGDQAPRGWHWVHLVHVITFLNRYLLTHREDLASVDLHDPALNWLSLLHKCNLTLVEEAPDP